jgi:excisionase family DNA binding protein
MEQKIDVKRAYSVQEVSEITGLSKGYLRNEIRVGRLAARRFGRRVLVTRESLDRFIDGSQEVK